MIRCRALRDEAALVRTVPDLKSRSRVELYEDTRLDRERYRGRGSAVNLHGRGDEIRAVCQGPGCISGDPAAHARVGLRKVCYKTRVQRRIIMRSRTRL